MAPARLHPPSQVGEFGVVLQERELDFADRAAPVFGDVDLGDSSLRRIGVVDLVPVDEHHHVRILLNRVVKKNAVSYKVVIIYYCGVVDRLRSEGFDFGNLLPQDVGRSLGLEKGVGEGYCGANVRARRKSTQIRCLLDAPEPRCYRPCRLSSDSVQANSIEEPRLILRTGDVDA